MKLEKNIINCSYLDNSDFGRFLQIKNLTETEKTYEPIEYCCLNLGDWNIEHNAVINPENFSKIKRPQKRQNKSKWLLALLLLLRLPKIPKLNINHNSLKNEKSTNSAVLLQKSKMINPQIFSDVTMDKNIQLHEKPAMNEIFYSNRKKALGLEHNHKKYYGAHTTAIVSILALLAVSSQNFIPPLSTARNLERLGQIENKLNVSQEHNDTLQKEINRLKTEITTRQNAINKEGTELLNEITSGSKTIEEVLEQLQVKINEQNQNANSHSPALDVNIETAKKLLEKMEEKKTKLLNAYAQTVSEGINTQNREIKTKLDNILSDTNGVFSKLPEGAKTAVTKEIETLNQEMEQDAKDFSEKLTKDIETYKREIQISINDAKNQGITVEVLKEVRDLADQELTKYIEKKTTQYAQESIKKIQDRQSKIIKKLLEAATESNQKDLMNKINSAGLDSNTATKLKAILGGMLNGEFIPSYTVSPEGLPTENPPAQPDPKKAVREFQYDLERQQARDKRARDEILNNPFYAWCNGGGGWWAALKHVGTVGACTGWTAAANVDLAIQGQQVDWDGIFNIVNAVSLVFDVVAITSGVGAVTAVVKTALKTGATHALKTAAKIVGKQVVKTAFMSGVGGSIGANTSVGLGTGLIAWSNNVFGFHK